MGRRLKILISAFACNPEKGSEHGVGWGWVTAVAGRHEVWAIVAGRDRAAIERAVAADPGRYENIHFSYVRWWCPRWLDKLWPPTWLWCYRLWQRRAYRMARHLRERVEFDLAHLVTYVGFRTPGHLWKLDIPFVWGPVGGLENTPWRLLGAVGFRGLVYYACRNLTNAAHRLVLIAPRRAMRAAAGVIAATEGIRREIRRWYGRDSEVICEIGTPEPVAKDHSIRQDDQPLRIAWSGQHLPGKALGLLLEAAARLDKRVDWRLDILGAGPCTERWKRQARRLGLDGRCAWHGWLPREQAIRTMRQAHLFVITSIKDLTSSVLLEALNQGVPVICPDHCGFANVVTDDCGVNLPVRSPRQLVGDLAEAIERLSDDEPRRRRLAAGALERIGRFSWSRKAEAIDGVYEKALSVGRGGR